MTSKEFIHSFINYLLSNCCIPELGTGKQIILLSWKLDTVCDKCYNRDIGAPVRLTSFNLSRRKGEGEKLG